MPQPNEQVQLIGDTILLQAEQDRATLIAKANAIRDMELATCKEQLINEMFVDLQLQTRQIRQKTVGEIAKAELSASRKLLKRREELTASVFFSVRTRLLDYVTTPEYKNNLLESLKALKDHYNHQASTIYLRENDLCFADDIQEILSGSDIQADPAISIGGFRLKNTISLIVIDETLDSKLKDTRPWFLENCKLKVL